MRSAALWAAGAALAFLLTAGAFLFLANLATAPPAEDLPAAPARGEPGPALDLDLNRDRLSSLQPAPDQELLLTVQNAGGRDFSNVNLTLGVSSENTASPDYRYYRHKVEKLAAGETNDVRFEFDLSAPEPTAAKPPAAVSESSRRILEIRATTPEGAQVVRTVVLPL
ncbi:MAG: hypothetical protein M3N33_04310 [Actinomycetota bacterium]|nr:hypothetical protein [Actinomycetota bacterium]